MLIVEDEEGNYQPIGMAGSMAEAAELAQADMAMRKARLEADKDPGICPHAYRYWSRGFSGEYRAHVVQL